jgi:hypothetical protein
MSQSNCFLYYHFTVHREVGIKECWEKWSYHWTALSSPSITTLLFAAYPTQKKIKWIRYSCLLKFNLISELTSWHIYVNSTIIPG